jgi:hypothetical protein
MSLEGPQIGSRKHQDEWFVRRRVNNCTALMSLDGPQIGFHKYQNEWVVRWRIDNCTALIEGFSALACSRCFSALRL